MIDSYKDRHQQVIVIPPLSLSFLPLGSKSFGSSQRPLAPAVTVKTGLMQRRHRQKGTKVTTISNEMHA